MNQTPEKEKGMSFIKKAGKWAPLVGGAWIVLNIVVPLALLRIPAVQKYLVVLEDNLPFNIPGIGSRATEIICFFLLGIAALLLNAGLGAQVLPLFWLILPLVIKLSFDNITRKKALLINKKTK